MKIWKAQNKPIVVGMRLDGHENLLIKSTLSLARKLQSKVELVHSFESAIGYSSTGEILPKATNNSETLHNPWSEKRARGLLQSLADAAEDQLDIHIHVERGDPAENLSRIAKEVNAGLIVCGMRDQSDPLVFKGLSTALSLAFYAPVPLLILPTSVALDFQNPSPILIADSLGGEGWQVLESGLQLARQLDCDAVYHSHVLKASETDIHATLQDMAESARQGQLSQDSPLTADQLKKTLLQKINEELFYRFHNTSCCKDLLKHYHPLAAMGDIDSEVSHIIGKTKAQLVIMGRHQFHCNRKLTLDHIPYRSIMERKAGLLVIPNYEEAHLRVKDSERDARTGSDKESYEMPQPMEAIAGLPS